MHLLDSLQMIFFSLVAAVLVTHSHKFSIFSHISPAFRSLRSPPNFPLRFFPETAKYFYRFASESKLKQSGRQKRHASRSGSTGTWVFVKSFQFQTVPGHCQCAALLMRKHKQPKEFIHVIVASPLQEISDH